MFRLVFSKQADYDADVREMWLRWYREEFRADEILVTPVKTPVSQIDETVAFYEAAGCRVQPIMVPDGWNDGIIWKQQLALAREMLPKDDWIAVSADADQFFSSPTDVPNGKTAVPFRHLNVLFEGPARIGVLPWHGECVGGFVRSLDVPNVGITGHWAGPRPNPPTPIAFHLHFRGLDHFRSKVSTVCIDPAGRRWANHWQRWSAIRDTKGTEEVETTYRQLTARFLLSDAWSKEIQTDMEHFCAFLTAPVES